jgi:hypothetical protein
VQHVAVVEAVATANKSELVSVVAAKPTVELIEAVNALIGLHPPADTIHGWRLFDATLPEKRLNLSR